MRRIVFGLIAVLGSAAFLLFTLGSSSGSSGRTYRIELDNAYDLVKGGEFKVAGVNAGSIKSIDLDRKTLHAVVTVQVTQAGFGQFHKDVFCDSRPQSLIGEYYVDCEPGTQGPVLPSGSTIPASHTQSTIPPDLVQNIMRVPYRERFSIIINELGAAVAARSEDLQTALRRADPALAQTDNLLALLANDARTIRDLNASANTVITALAKNNRLVQNFIQYADRASVDSATQAPSITATWKKLPGFLEQLRPAMKKLGAASQAQIPVLNNLNASASNLERFFHDLVPFSLESIPSLRSLGNASVTGRQAVNAATPTVRDLNKFAQHVPELAGNLAIVLHALNSRKYAVEPDRRSPDGGKGFTGLEALLQYVYNQTLAINYITPYGHELGVDAFISTVCSPYATPQTIANSISSNGLKATRSCYAFLGPNQQGVNETDPTWNAKRATSANPSRCVPDPGGFPIQGYGTHYFGPPATACKLAAKSSGPAKDRALIAQRLAAGAGLSGQSPITLQQLLREVFSGVTGNVPSSVPSGDNGGSGAKAGTHGGTAGDSSTNETQQLLNYLLGP